MLDFNGIEVRVGDKVIYTNRNFDYLKSGIISKITKSKAVVELNPPRTLQYNKLDGTIRTWIEKNEDNIMSSCQMLKI